MELFFHKSEQGYLITALPFSNDVLIDYANPAALHMLNLSKDELLQHKIADIFPKAEITPSVASTAPFSYGAENKTLKLYLSSFGPDRCLCMIASQTEEGRRCAMQLEKYRCRMETALENASIASQSKTNFLSEITHDIRTPMNAIMGMTDIALNYAGDPDKVTDCLHKIQTASGHLVELVNGILDLSRIESGKIILKEENIRLTDQLHELLILIKPQADARKIRLHVGLHHIVHEDLIGDPVRLRQIVLNLLSNAVKYTPEGGDIWLELSETTKEDTVSLTITVKDNGIGMTPEFLHRIFDPFEREPSPAIGRIQGTGLGLPIAKKLVTMMKGTISVQSIKGEGTQFQVSIPFRFSGKACEKAFTKPQAADGKKPDKRNVQDHSSKRIMIAEDNELNLEIERELLSLTGVQIDFAHNGQEAVELFETRPEYYYDLIFMDIKMPVMDGLCAARTIRALPRQDARKIPIIAMTANAFFEDRQISLEAGMNDHITKPLNVNQLLDCLDHIEPRKAP